MYEEEYTEIEEDEILPDEQELDNDFYDGHDRNAYMKVDRLCPNPACRKATLEYQIFGTEKEIFCTSCPFHQTVQL